MNVHIRVVNTKFSNLEIFIFDISFNHPGSIHLWMSDYHPDGAALSEGEGTILIMATFEISRISTN